MYFYSLIEFRELAIGNNGCLRSTSCFLGLQLGCYTAKKNTGNVSINFHPFLSINLAYFQLLRKVIFTEIKKLISGSRMIVNIF